jgi:predicted transcriptional regulator
VEKINTKGTGYAVAFKQGKTVEQIAKFFGVSDSAVKQALIKKGLVTPDRRNGNGKNFVAELQRRISEIEKHNTDVGNKLSELDVRVDTLEHATHTH